MNGPSPQPDPIRVGSLVVQPVLDGVAVLDRSMFTTADGAADWTAHEHLLDGEGKMTIPVGAFVVRTGDDVVLLDAGVGDVHDEMFDGGALLASLRTIGLTPADITKVFVSHLHSDHMGWLECGGAVTFPNATVRIGSADWEHYVTQKGAGATRAARLRVVEKHVQLIERDGESIAAGITTRATPGHTPGHTSVVLSSGTQRMIVLGDALHCPAQLTEVEWQFLFDADKDLAQRTREALVREADDPNTALLPMHFPGMVAARLLPGQGQRNWVFN